MSVNVERIREIFADYAPEKGNLWYCCMKCRKHAETGFLKRH
jgi:hypothetical protein